MFTTQGHESSRFMRRTNLVTSDMVRLDLKKQSNKKTSKMTKHGDCTFDVAATFL